MICVFFRGVFLEEELKYAGMLMAFRLVDSYRHFEGVQFLKTALLFSETSICTTRNWVNIPEDLESFISALTLPVVR